METPIHFYQTGTFTVGNRLLEPEARSNQASMERANSLNSGHRACQGCGEALGARYAIDAAMRAVQGASPSRTRRGALRSSRPRTRKRAGSSRGSLALQGTPRPSRPAWPRASACARRRRAKTRCASSPWAATAARPTSASGASRACSSRNDDVLYICFDNEAYMNTGVQRSSATPPAARTATTQIAGDEPGNPWGAGKNVPLIAMAHGIPRRDRDGRGPARPRTQG